MQGAVAEGTATRNAGDRAIPQMGNVALALGFVAINGYQLVGLPALVHRQGARALWFLVPGALLNNTMWALLHEAIHGVLLASRPANHRWGRVLGILFGSPYRLLKESHLLHHKYNRTMIERSDTWDLSRGSAWRGRRVFYGNLLGGLYLQELFMPLMFLLPRDWVVRRARTMFEPATYNGKIAENLLEPRAYAEGRRDTILIWALFALSAGLYGRWAWVLLVILGFRALSISFLDYIYHYGSPFEDKLHGYNLELPPWMSAWILHFNYHGLHHRNPALSWRKLPRTFREHGRSFDGGYWRAAFRQLRGPIFNAPSETATQTEFDSSGLFPKDRSSEVSSRECIPESRHCLGALSTPGGESRPP
jgi:fatty acid desaturase